jgi:RNA polymerase sigma-70 factor, ECF subfamily
MTPSERVCRERGLRSAVLAGDEQAWQTWYDESFAGLATYAAWRCVGLRDLADDLVQDTWLTAVRQIRSFDPEKGSFADWLRGIAANLLRNHFRKLRLRGRPPHSLNGHPGMPHSPADDHDLAEHIARALSQLPERFEAVLRAKYLDQKSVAEIGESWSESPKTIESLLTRARQAFREVYQTLE